jgi:uncharacterized membrane protein (DUF106 family)
MFSNTLFKFTINIAISIIIIYGAHSFWNYLKDNYTTKKTKDLVNIQIEKYKRIMNDMQKQNEQSSLFEDESEKQSMNDDLLEFMNQQTQEN